MYRKQILASALALAFAGGDAHALDLGGMRTLSALNQPFVGEIDLLEAKPDELDQVKARIAPVEEFTKAGLERYQYLTKLRFSPQVSPAGQTVIRVTSEEAIREPYLDFLIEVEWPNGQVVKEYTILLDPPPTTGRGTPKIEPPIAATAVGGSGSADALKPTSPAAAPAPAAPPAGAGAGSYPLEFGPIRSGTGLWRIATGRTPPGATAAQTAMALYRNNQDAFIRGDINRLIANKTLEIPSAAELFALDPGAADQEYRAALRGDTVRRAPIADVSPEATADEGKDSRLKIAGAAPDSRTAGKPATAAETAAMEQELLLVREAGESTQRETLELRDRIRELEGQLADIQRLLQLRNAELARLQDGRDSTPGAAQPPGETEVARDADLQAALLTSGAAPESPEREVDETTAEASSPRLDGAPDTGPVAEEDRAATGDEAGAAKPETAATVASDEAAPDAVDGEPIWSSIPLPVAGLGAAGVLGLGLLWSTMRRRRARSDLPTDRLEPELDTQEPVTQEPTAEPVAATPQPPVKTPRLQVPRRGDRSTAGESTRTSTFLIPGEMEADESDVISEADVYIAYGRYREAEALLQDEIDQSPGRLDVKLKLAETYVGARNRAALDPLLLEIESAGGHQMYREQWQALKNQVAAGLAGPSHDEAIATTQDKAAPDAAESFALQDDGPLSLDVGEYSGTLSGQPRIATLRPVAASSALDDVDGPLSLDNDPISRDLDLPEDSEEIGYEDDLTIPRGTSYFGGGDLELTIDDLRAASDVDLDSLVDANRGAAATQDLPATDTETEQPAPPRPALHAVGNETNLFPASTTLLDGVSSEILDASSDLLSSQWQMDSGLWDEIATKLDLARAYVEMEDGESAKGILEEVVTEGSEQQRGEAQEMLRQLG